MNPNERETTVDRDTTPDSRTERIAEILLIHSRLTLLLLDVFVTHDASDALVEIVAQGLHQSLLDALTPHRLSAPPVPSQAHAELLLLAVLGSFSEPL